MICQTVVTETHELLYFLDESHIDTAVESINQEKASGHRVDITLHTVKDFAFFFQSRDMFNI